jgi:plasmid stabilization system protein ParE
MADFRLSSQADTDLARIADYTIETFGIEQARRYRDGLEACFQSLADNPLLGQNANHLAAQLRHQDTLVISDGINIDNTHESPIKLHQFNPRGVGIVPLYAQPANRPRGSQPASAALN